MCGLKYMCAIVIVAGLSDVAHAQLTLIDDDVAATIQANSDLTDLQVNSVSGPGAGLPDHLDHVDKHSIYVDGAHASALGGPGLTTSTANTADYTFGDGTLQVDISYSLQGGATAGDDPDGHYTASYHAKLVVTNTSTALVSTRLISVQDLTLSRFVQTGSFAQGPSTENATAGGSGNHVVTQVEIGDNAGFLISQAITTLTALEDINRNGSVDDLDLAILLGNFGTVTPGGPTVGDLNNNGAVDDPDLAQILSVFGTTTISHFEVVSDGSSEAQVRSGQELRDLASTNAGPGNTGDDINSAFQVDLTLASGESRTFWIESIVTPEPACLPMLGIGAAMLAGGRSRQSRVRPS